MNISKIIYYTRIEGRSKTLSLRDLCLRDEFDLESIFHAVRDAVDTDDLLGRISRIVYEPVEFDAEKESYIRFTVMDVYGHTNYLKFKKEKK